MMFAAFVWCCFVDEAQFARRTFGLPVCERDTRFPQPRRGLIYFV
jgi:hypothetical protein